MPQYSFFKNINSGQVLDVENASKAADASVVQNPQQGSPIPDVANQVWEALSVNYTGPVPAGFGPCLIINKNSGLVLDVDNASKAAGARVIQYPQHSFNSPDLPNQLWVIQPVKSPEPNSNSYIINVNSGLLLDVDNASKAPGALVIQYPKHSYTAPDLPNQVWAWEFVVTGTGTGTGTHHGTGTNGTGTNDTSTGDTSTDDTGTDDTGTDDTGTDDTGTDDTGTDDTGTNDTGTDDGGTDDGGTGDGGTGDGEVVRGPTGGMGSGTGH